MKKEWRLYRLQLDKTYLMYFQLDEVSFDSYRFDSQTPLVTSFMHGVPFTRIYTYMHRYSPCTYQCTIKCKCTLCFQCDEPKQKIIRSKIVSATAGEFLLIKKVNRFTFVVNFSDDTPSWIFAADTEVSCKSIYRRGVYLPFLNFGEICIYI